MNARHITARAALVGAVLVAASALGTPGAWADASSRASCIGLESSSIAPPGSTTEFPGGRSEASHFVKQIATQLGISPGAVISSVAHLHAGSHEACDEATE